MERPTDKSGSNLRVSKRRAVHPELVEGSRFRSWFDYLTTNAVGYL